MPFICFSRKNNLFEELEYPLAINDETDAEKQKVANDRAGTLRNVFYNSLASELNAIPEPKANESKRFSPEDKSLWASYFKDGLISASELVEAVDSYNSNRGDRAPIEEIDLFWTNLYNEGKDVVYFSKEGIQNLNGTGVWIYDTNRKEEFTGLNCQEETYFTGKGRNRQEHVALYVFGEQIEEGEENEQNEEEGGEEEQADDNEQENQNEMQFEEHNVDNLENNENNAEEKDQVQQPEQEQHEKQYEEQPQMKLTMELLRNPDDETKKLFAEMDLKAFLDKAEKDLTEAGEDPRSAYIDFVALCSGDETLKSKISLDVLLQYPLWQYGVNNVLSEEDKNKLGNLHEKVLEFTREGKSFYVFPPLCTIDKTLTVEDNEDLKYLIEKRKDGLKMLAFAVKYALQNGKNISVIDISNVTLQLNAEHHFKYFAGLPVSLRGKWLETKSKEIDDRHGFRNLSKDTMLVRQNDGTFRVRYEPENFYEAFGIADVFVKNLHNALIQYANFPAGNDALKKAVQSLEVEDFKRIPFLILNDGKLKTADDVRFGCNKKHLFDLIYGTAKEDFMESWSKFLGKLKSFDPKYYNSLILFFPHWDGSDRVDFQRFQRVTSTTGKRA